MPLSKVSVFIEPLHNGVDAIRTVAHKLARACYHMLRTGSDFDVDRAFA